MPAVAKIDVLQNRDGRNLMINGYPQMPGRIIEYLTSMCDGSMVQVCSGTYQFQSVTAIQASTTSYVEVNGSVLNYCPPAGTTMVTYRYNFSQYWGATHAINDYKFFINQNEVVNARTNKHNGQNIEERSTFEWNIPIGGVANTSTGRQATWTNLKKLYLMVRQYGASNYSNLNSTYYWDGASAIGTNLSMPELTIIATA